MADEAVLKAKLTMDDSPFQAGLKRAATGATSAGKTIAGALKNVGTSSLKTMGGVVSSLVTGPLAALSAGIAGALAGRAIYRGISNVYDAGAALYRLHEQTGASVGTLAQLSGAFGQADVDAESLGTAIGRMQKQLVSATPKAAAAFSALGASADQLKAMDPAAAFGDLGSRLNAVSNPAEKAAYSMAIFGGAGRELLKVFASDAFKGVGGPLTGKAKIMADNAETFYHASLALTKAGKSLKGLYVGLAGGFGAVVLPALNKLASLDLVGTGQRFGVAIGKAVELLYGGFLYPRAALYVLGQTLQAVLRDGINVLHAGFKSAGQYFGGIMAVISPAMQSIFSAVGGLMTGIAEKFAGKLMQAPKGLILMLGAGFEYVTGVLPGQIKSGLQTALEYLQAGFKYVAGALTGDVAKGLLSSVLKFATAMASPIATVKKMWAEAMGDGAGSSFTDALKAVRSSKVFAAMQAPVQTMSDAYKRAVDSMADGVEELSSKGNTLELQGDSRMTAALEQFAKVGATLPANLAAALKANPGFKVEDVAGAGAYHARANAGLAGLQSAGAKAMGLGQTAVGVPQWLIDTANRINSVGTPFGFSAPIGTGLNTGGLQTGGLSTGGLLSGAAYDADAARRRQAARNAAAEKANKGTEVTSAALEKKLDLIIAGTDQLKD